MAPRYFQPALLGGLMMGVLSALPLINVANCCCLWVIGGGVVAAYLLQQSHPRPLSAGDGALVGLLAGLMGAVVWLVVSIPVNMALGPFQRRMFERLLDNAQDLPDNMRSLFEGTGSGAVMGVAYLVQFVLWLCIGAVFSTLGGLLGVAIFKKKLPPGDTGTHPIDITT